MEGSLKWVDSVFNSLTPAQRIGQLIMVETSSDDENSSEEIGRLIRDHNIGGIVFLQGGPLRQVNMTNLFQSVSKTPLLIAMNAEWGLGTSLDSTVIFPRNMTLGALQDNRLIYEMASDLARQLRRIGVHINLGPVLDVNDNPRNPVMGSRSFGQDIWTVTEKAGAYMQGLQDNGIMAAGKYFPGNTDTGPYGHASLTVFRTLITRGIGGIMTSPPDPEDQADGPVGMPAVFNDLREETGFSGLAICDIKATTGSAGDIPGHSEVRALVAGNDILLSSNIDKAIDAIQKAVTDGIISQEAIDERCRRVLMAKYRMGLNKPSVVSTRNLYGDLDDVRSELIKRRITAASLTLVENRDNIIPLRRIDTLNIASVSIGAGQKSVFQETIDLYAPVKHFSVNKYSSLEVFASLINELDKFNLVIVSIDDADLRRSRQYGISPQTSYFVRRLAERNNVVMTVFTSPYGLAFFDDLSNISALLMAYEDSRVAQEYSAQLLFGGMGISGRLPVSAIARYTTGTGYETAGLNRLGYSIPEDAGLDSRKLREIDNIINNAIGQQATPGAQVLVARRGIVVYHKAFGHHTYTLENPVRVTDLYDLASITKIAASVPAIMKLKDQGKLDLGLTLGHYLPALQGTNKQDLVIMDILTHQARMQSWIPFIYNTFESLVPGEELFSRRISARYPYMLGDYMFMNRHYRLSVRQFNDQQEGDFNIRVANRMFMNRSFLDSMYLRIDASPLRTSNGYFYSDLGYYYLKKIIEHLSSEPLEYFVEKNFYRHLGASRLTYLPLEKYFPGEIVPTENDMVFRRQLVHGHVHDAGAAMIGGVGGHAGLFSNANDLAKLMQVYLQKGEYGGYNFFSAETVRQFTSAPNGKNGNRRGIGFDKPEISSSRSPAARSASPESFGHSGFTGTITWVDPREEIVYIFLSNRVHPDQFNNKLTELSVRTSIQQVIYDSIVN
jgi:beta-N-acetylhexosaminidase